MSFHLKLMTVKQKIKKVAIIKDNKIIEIHESIRAMCRKKGFDRRRIMRILHNEKGFNQYKGLKFILV